MTGDDYEKHKNNYNSALRHELFVVHRLSEGKEQMPGLQVKTPKKQCLSKMHDIKVP